MAPGAVSSAHPATSTEAQLRALVARGFRFIDPRDENGDVVAVVGVRAHRDVVDVVQLHDEDDAVASRIPADQDIMAPRRVFWQVTGVAQDVLRELLELPDERSGLLHRHDRVSA